MYIFIFEDGVPCQSDEIHVDDIQAFEEGLLDIINSKNMKQMTAPGEWEDLPNWLIDA